MWDKHYLHKENYTSENCCWQHFIFKFKSCQYKTVNELTAFQLILISYYLSKCDHCDNRRDLQV